MTTPAWHIELLGGLRAWRLSAPGEALEQAPIESFRTAKTASLLAFLVYHRGWHTREFLAEKIWPDAEPKRARNSLRVALSSLRELFSESAAPLEITRTQVRLAPAATTDVERFRALALQAATQTDKDARLRALESAVALVRGPLLPGFYDDWVAPATARLEEEFLAASRPLMAMREARGDLLGALDAARRGAAVAPLREGVMRDIVRLGLACNQDAHARAEFGAWRTRLQRVAGESAPQWDEWLRAHGLAGAGASAPIAPAQTTPARAAHDAARGAMPGATHGAMPGAARRRGRALPGSAHSFVGRRAERTTLETWLDERSTRLITITGPGGAGKTRLALELARELNAQKIARAGRRKEDEIESTNVSANASDWGTVAWAPLANLPSSRLVPGALLDALGAPHGSETIETVARAIGEAAAQSGRRVLLWLDNCEHLESGLPPLLSQLLAAAPALVVVATSRSPLRVSGERSFALRPLDAASNAVEAGGDEPLAGQISVSDAMQLFIERARLVRPALGVAPADLGDIARICAQLGGLPLAIEVAAARVALFSLAQMADELERAAPQLAPPIANVNATQNGDIAAAANSVAGVADVGADAKITGHTTLFGADASFGDAASFGATDDAAPLDWANPDADVAARHRSLRAALDWSYAQLPAAMAQFWAQLSVFSGGFSVEAAASICRDSGAETGEAHSIPTMLLGLRDSSLLALNASGEAPRGEWIEVLRAYAAERLTPAQQRDLRARHAAYFLRWVETQTPLLDGPSTARARARLEIEAPNLREAFEWLLREDIEGALRGCAALWLYWEHTGRLAESRSTLERALHAAARAFPEPADADAPLDDALKGRLNLRANCYEGAGKLAYFSADHERAQNALNAALSLYRRVGNEVGAANCLYSLGFGALKSGDLENARQLCEQSLTIHRRRRDTAALGDALYNLSLVALMAGDYAAVRELSNERLALHRAAGNRRDVAISLENLGLAALFSGETEAAAAYFEEALLAFEALGEGPSVARALWGLGQVERARGRGDAARARFGRALHLARTTENLWAFPYLMESFGALAGDDGDDARGARLLAGAATWRANQGEPLPSPPMQAAFQTECQRLRARLGEAAFEAQWTLGGAMSLNELLDLMSA